MKWSSETKTYFAIQLCNYVNAIALAVQTAGHKGEGEREGRGRQGEGKGAPHFLLTTLTTVYTQDIIATRRCNQNQTYRKIQDCGDLDKI